MLVPSLHSPQQQPTYPHQPPCSLSVTHQAVGDALHDVEGLGWLESAVAVPVSVLSLYRSLQELLKLHMRTSYYTSNDCQ